MTISNIRSQHIGASERNKFAMKKRYEQLPLWSFDFFVFVIEYVLLYDHIKSRALLPCEML